MALKSSKLGTTTVIGVKKSKVTQKSIDGFSV
jgi:hypothetical protein